VRFRPAKEVPATSTTVSSVNGRRGFLVADVCDKASGPRCHGADPHAVAAHAEQPAAGGRTISCRNVGGQQWRAARAAADAVRRRRALVQSVVGTNRYMARNHLGRGYFAPFLRVLDLRFGACCTSRRSNPPVSSAPTARSHPAADRPGPSHPRRQLVHIGAHHTRPATSCSSNTDGRRRRPDIGRQPVGYERMLEPSARRATAPSNCSTSMDTQLAARRQANQFDDITMLAVRDPPNSAGTRRGRSTGSGPFVSGSWRDRLAQLGRQLTDRRADSSTPGHGMPRYC